VTADVSLSDPRLYLKKDDSELRALGPKQRGEQMPKYVNVEMDKFAAPLVIEADTVEVEDHELLVKLGDAIVARVPWPIPNQLQTPVPSQT